MVINACPHQVHLVNAPPCKSCTSPLAASFAWLRIGAGISSGRERRNTSTALPILASDTAIKRIWLKPFLHHR
jgi:hypothetical protein